MFRNTLEKVLHNKLLKLCQNGPKKGEEGNFTRNLKLLQVSYKTG